MSQRGDIEVAASTFIKSLPRKYDTASVSKILEKFRNSAVGKICVQEIMSVEGRGAAKDHITWYTIPQMALLLASEKRLADYAGPFMSCMMESKFKTVTGEVRPHFPLAY